MTSANLKAAHAAMQELKNHPDVLRSFRRAISDIGAATGLASDDSTLAYVVNALSNQRNLSPNAAVAKLSGTKVLEGFLIKAAIDTSS